MAGGFTVNIEVEGASGTITVVANGDGPLEISLEAGEMTGTWSIVDGVQTVGGTISGSAGGQTVDIIFIGDGTLNGSGTMVGPRADYRLQGSLTQTNTINVNVGGIASSSSTSADTNQLNAPLTDVIVLCQDIVGRWDLQVRQQVAAADAAVPQASFDEFVRGYFTASTGVDATEQAEEVAELLSAVSSWAGEANSIESEDRGLYIGRGLAMLDQAQRLQAELSVDSPCPPDPTFATQLTLAAQDVLSTLIDRSRVSPAPPLSRSPRARGRSELARRLRRRPRPSRQRWKMMLVTSSTSCSPTGLTGPVARIWPAWHGPPRPSEWRRSAARN